MLAGEKDLVCLLEMFGGRDEFVGQIVTTCGLIVEQRTHHQITGEPMKFLSLADWTGIMETELFAATYKSLSEKSKGANVHASRRSMRRVMAR